MTRDLAQQWTGRKGIRVNAIAPRFFESEMTGEYPDGYLDAMMFRVPMAARPDRARSSTRCCSSPAGVVLHHRNRAPPLDAGYPSVRTNRVSGRTPSNFIASAPT
jgi:NAD(P)-dependent dehydrogenase (short-subunit alcohol dehydrogenase family)